MLDPRSGTKSLELLKEAFPHASRVGVLATRYPGRSPYSEQLQEAAQRLGLLLLAPRLEGTLRETEYRRLFEVLAQEHADSLYVGTEPESWVYRRLIVELAEKYRLPAIYPAREYVEAGGLMSCGASLVEAYRQAGIYAGMVLKGEKPADLPVMQSTKFELVINLKAAKTLGLSVPPTLLATIDEVIE